MRCHLFAKTIHVVAGPPSFALVVLPLMRLYILTHTQPFYGSMDFFPGHLGKPVPVSECLFTYSHQSSLIWRLYILSFIKIRSGVSEPREGVENQLSALLWLVAFAIPWITVQAVINIHQPVASIFTCKLGQPACLARRQVVKPASHQLHNASDRWSWNTLHTTPDTTWCQCRSQTNITSCPFVAPCTLLVFTTNVIPFHWHFGPAKLWLGWPVKSAKNQSVVPSPHEIPKFHPVH